ncbi:MAG: sodium/solute symporter [Planctomycetes bacterium]|nr:sodium/solute symporter [Planctomycetota bacterium]
MLAFAPLVLLVALLPQDARTPSSAPGPTSVAASDAPASRLPWDADGPVPRLARADARLVLLDGRLLAVGGRDGRGVPSDAVSVLAPDGWADAPSLPVAWCPAAALADDDGALLLGGDEARGPSAAVRRVRREASGAWAWDELPALPHAGRCAAARVGTRVFALVGDDLRPDDGSRAARLFVLERADPTPSWRVLPDDPARPPLAVDAALAVASAGDGRPFLLLAGGRVASEASRGTLALSPDTLRWTRLADLPAPRAGAVTLALGRGDVLLFPRDDGTPDARVLAYHPVTDTWRAVGDAPCVDPGSTAALPDGRLAVLDADGALHTARIERRATHLAALDGVVVLAYLLLLVLIGAAFARGNRVLDDYLLAGRSLRWWSAGLSIHGTQISAITFLATPALAYATDLRYLPTWAAILFMAPVVTVLYLPFFRRFDATTAYVYLERRFSPAVRVLASVAFMLFQLARLAIVLYLPALALGAVTSLPTWLAILVMGGLCTLYTVLGGLRAVVWTDVLQVAVLLGGVGLALGLALSDVGGASAALADARSHGKLLAWDGAFRWTDAGSWSLMIGAFFLQFGPYTTDQAVVQRYLAARDERSAARAIWLNGWMSVPAALLFPTLGAALWIWFRARPDALPLGMANDEVFPVFMSTRLPPGVAGLVVAGLLAAVMSTLDSSLHSVASAFVEDVHRKLRPALDDAARLRLARRVTVSVGVLATGAALVLARWDTASLFLVFQTAVGLLSSGVAGAFLLGLLTRRAHASGVLVGMAAATGLLVWVTWFTRLHPFWYGFVGIAACVLVGGLASLLLPGPPAGAGLTWADVRTARAERARIG